MVQFGYTLLCEQRSPRDLVADARGAEDVGFDFLAISDHFHPWLESQGQSPFAWSVLGTLAEATTRVPLMTMVTCPTVRYHPVIVAQMAATVSLLTGGRFALGVGAGEKLNEHVVGAGWPPASTRHEMLMEAIDIMRHLWSGGFQSYDGDYFTVEDARIYSLPERPPPIHVAAGGPQAATLAGQAGDGLIATEADPELVRAFRAGGGEGKPCYGQVALCYAEDETTAVRTAYDLWRFAIPGWKVMAELPNPVNFEAAATAVTPEDVRRLVPCGPDPDVHVAAIEGLVDAGFDRVVVLQVGPEQEGFQRFWTEQVRPRLDVRAVAR